MTIARRCFIDDGSDASLQALATQDPQAAIAVSSFRSFLVYQAYEAEISAARQCMLDDGAPALTPEQSLALARSHAPGLL